MRPWTILLVGLCACDPVTSSSDDSPGEVDAGEPDAPTACTSPAVCTNPDAPVCASDGVCVGCETGADCGGTTPLCGEDRVCRGCSKDSECEGGICVEATGVCVADAEVAFLAQAGTDSGACTRAAPCATYDYVHTQLGTRTTVHVLGDSYASTVSLRPIGDMVLDGSGTQLQIYGNQINLAQAGNAIVEGFKLVAPPPSDPPVPAIDVSGQSRAIIRDVEIDGDGGVTILVTGLAEAVVSRSRFGRLASTSTNELNCTSGKLIVEDSVLEKTRVSSFNSCELTVRRNRFESPNDGSVSSSNGQLIMENNLVIHSDGYNDSIYATNLRPGSAIRFNTIVNTTPVPLDGSAIYCDGSLIVSSNIFAYQSGHPITGTGCEVRYSIFDSYSTTSAGTGNQVSDDLFVGEDDYHLSTTSLARGGAEPGLIMVTEDLEGNPRPAGGTVADCGAFEAE